MSNNTTTKKINTAKLLKSIFSLVMVLSILVGCSMMFVGCSQTGKGDETQPAGGSKHDPAEYEGLNDEEYAQKLAYNYLGDAVSALTKGYNAYTGVMGSTSGGMKVGVTLTVGDSVLDMLEEITAGSMSMKFLSKITMDMTVGTKDQLTSIDMDLGLNSKKIATVKMITDIANYAIYMGVPEISDAYVKMDMADAMGSSGVDMSAQGMAANAAKFVEALPSGEKLETLLKGYLELAVKEMDKVERTTVKQELSGLKQDQNEVTVKLYQEDLLDMAKAILKKAENDADIKQIVTDVVKAAAEMTGETIDEDEVYAQFQDGVKNALEMVEASYEDLDTENYIELKIYTDSNHYVVGVVASMPGENSAGIDYISVTEGEKTAMQLAVNGYAVTDGYGNPVSSSEPVLEIAGEGTVKSGKTTGTYTVEVQGEKMLTVETKNLDANGGTITLKPTEDVLNSLGGADLPFEDLALEITLDDGELELNVLSGKEKLLGIALEAKESSAGTIKLPANYVDGTDSNALMEWVSNARFNTLINNLKSAGVPSELTDMLEMYIGG